jgi:endonuclease/exonuclease/phosphatase family metal-dependent hydrolase
MTINVALITLTVFGVPVFSFEANAPERFKELVNFLLPGEHDIVTLQEISPYWSKKLIKSLSTVYPHFATYSTQKLISTEMLILSKNPITDCTFKPFDFDTKLELMVLEKGMLACTIKSETQEYVVLSTHLVALGLSESPTSPYVETIRGKQINQLTEYANTLVSENPERLLVITGDFNAGPEASNSNYELLLEHFVDLFALDEQENGKNTIRYTWLPGFDDNIAARKVFEESPPQRIDMIFIPKKQKHLLGIASDVTIVSNSFSDHSAVTSEIITE